MNSNDLLQSLTKMTLENLKAVERLKSAPIESLNWKEGENSWSVLECIEHLNRYGDFYIPEITNRIASSKHHSTELFKSSWLGKYFSDSVSYKTALNKMKTFQSMNPINSALTVKIIDAFIIQQYQIIDLLEKAKSVNLDKTKTSISISKLIKLRLGDTFRVVIYHNQRHIKQAEKTLKNSKQNIGSPFNSSHIRY